MEIWYCVTTRTTHEIDCFSNLIFRDRFSSSPVLLTSKCEIFERSCLAPYLGVLYKSCDWEEDGGEKDWPNLRSNWLATCPTVSDSFICVPDIFKTSLEFAGFHQDAGLRGTSISSRLLKSPSLTKMLQGSFVNPGLLNSRKSLWKYYWRTKCWMCIR